jgi:proteasome lid subunit RPN8/RPN11
MLPRVTLTIGDNERRAIHAHAKEAHPRECCGLLLGRGGSVREIVAAANLAESADRYTLDPKARLAAERRTDLDVIGFYHSHPEGDAGFSETDELNAEPGKYYVVTSPAGDCAYLVTDGMTRSCRLITAIS